MKKLPENFCIKRDENNPLWWKFRDWCNETRGRNWSFDVDEYYGFLNSSLWFAHIPFGTEITLEEWNEAVNDKEWMPEYMEEIEVWIYSYKKKNKRKFIAYVEGINYPWITMDGDGIVGQYVSAQPVNRELEKEIAELEKQLSEKRMQLNKKR